MPHISDYIWCDNTVTLKMLKWLYGHIYMIGVNLLVGVLEVFGTEHAFRLSRFCLPGKPPVLVQKYVQ